ncbi:MAG: hypothetical protein DLM64_00305 [Solirubrobacterales bacterium]|nr:MAG: hypothetical protein DLM64_00305 [Solirubrobacterales bacterium]
MRDQLVRIAAGGQLAIGVNPDGRAWLELTAPDGTATVHVGERELLLAIEALAMVYAQLGGARADRSSVALGVSRQLRSRTRGARERRSRAGESP